MKGGIVSVGTTIPSGTVTVGVNSDATKLFLEPNGGNGIITLEAEGTGTTNIVSHTVRMGDINTTVNGVVFSVSDVAKQASLTTTTGEAVSMYLQTANGTNAVVEIDDTTGLFIETAGTNAKFQSASGSVAISGNGVVLENTVGGSPNTTLTVGNTGSVVMEAAGSQNTVLCLQNTGGKYGQLTASETGGYMAIQAQAGYSLLMESIGGSVNIATTDPDTTLTASVNGGTGQITLTDVGGVGDVVLSAGNLVNTLKQTATATEITGDSGSGTPAVLQFTDPTLGNATATYRNDGFGFGGKEIALDTSLFSVSSGAVEGVSIGTNFTENIVLGNGRPLVIAQDITNKPTNYISLNNGDTTVVAQNTVSLGLGASPSVFVDANNSKLLIDSATASAGLQYDGVSATPVQFHFNSADFISGSAGGATGSYLRIFINGTPYKIALLSEA